MLTCFCDSSELNDNQVLIFISKFYLLEKRIDEHVEIEIVFTPSTPWWKFIQIFKNISSDFFKEDKVTNEESKSDQQAHQSYQPGTLRKG